MKGQEPTQVYGKLRPYPQTLDLTGKACQGQTLKLSMKIRILWIKML